MGCVLAVIGDHDDPELRDRMDRMLSRSPHRGDATRFDDSGISIAVQSSGWDASLSLRDHRVVAFAGFVGNWRELGARQYRTQAGEIDHAATLSEALDDRGEGVFGELRGEFAVLVLDRRTQILLALRDVVGCRPLHRSFDGSMALIATEIRQVIAGIGHVPEFNGGAILSSLSFLPQAAGETAFQGIEKVEPGSVLEICRDGSGLCEKLRCYWDLARESGDDLPSQEEWLEELRFRLKRSVRRWLPEHPSLVTVSGGLDSTSVWVHTLELANEGIPFAKEARPFSLFFPGLACDESEFIKKTMCWTSSVTCWVDGAAENQVSLRPALLEVLDTIPFHSTFSVKLLSDAAAQAERRTVVTGLFGDEWFDGNFCSISWKWKLLRALYGFAGVSQGLSLKRFFVDRLFRARRRRTWGVSDWVGQAWRSYVQQRRWDIGLARVSSGSRVASSLSESRPLDQIDALDQIGAASGVEFRQPFSDPDVITWADRAPSSVKFEGLTKPALRHVVISKTPPDVANRAHGTNLIPVTSNECVRSELPIKPGESAADWMLVRRGWVDLEMLDRLRRAADTEIAAKLTAFRLEEAEMFLRRTSEAFNSRTLGD